MMKKRTDTVHAMLTEKESVLNRNASELIGRDFIKRINNYGNILAKRGVDLASDPGPYPAGQNLEGYQYGTSDVGRDDRGDLMRDADNTFYGGGGAPAPTPTPTPTTRMYQRGTYSVDEDDPKRGYAPYGSGAASPRTIQAFINRYGVQDSRGNFTTPTPSGGTATVGPYRGRTTDRYRGIDINANPSRNLGQGQIIQRSGAGNSGYGIGNGALPPDQNPAYQAALARNPTPASRYATNRSQPSMTGTYQSPYGQRAVVDTGNNTFRTYDKQGGYIGRTGNATDYLNRQFGAVPTNQPASPVTPVQSTNVSSTPTSLSVITGRPFQPYNLEPNPFTGPTNLTLEQPRRYSDYY